MANWTPRDLAIDFDLPTGKNEAVIITAGINADCEATD
jgi:hypothetical protein